MSVTHAANPKLVSSVKLIGQLLSHAVLPTRGLYGRGIEVPGNRRRGPQAQVCKKNAFPVRENEPYGILLTNFSDKNNGTELLITVMFKNNFHFPVCVVEPEMFSKTV
jgi:hypothetical protein